MSFIIIFVFLMKDNVFMKIIDKIYIQICILFVYKLFVWILQRYLIFLVVGIESGILILDVMDQIVYIYDDKKLCIFYKLVFVVEWIYMFVYI